MKFLRREYYDNYYENVCTIKNYPYVHRIRLFDSKDMYMSYLMDVFDNRLLLNRFRNREWGYVKFVRLGFFKPDIYGTIQLTFREIQSMNRHELLKKLKIMNKEVGSNE